MLTKHDTGKEVLRRGRREASGGGSQGFIAGVYGSTKPPFKGALDALTDAVMAEYEGKTKDCTPEVAKFAQNLNERELAQAAKFIIERLGNERAEAIFNNVPELYSFSNEAAQENAQNLARTKEDIELGCLEKRLNKTTIKLSSGSTSNFISDMIRDHIHSPEGTEKALDIILQACKNRGQPAALNETISKIPALARALERKQAVDFIETKLDECRSLGAKFQNEVITHIVKHLHVYEEEDIKHIHALIDDAGIRLKSSEQAQAMIKKLDNELENARKKDEHPSPTIQRRAPQPAATIARKGHNKGAALA